MINIDDVREILKKNATEEFESRLAVIEKDSNDHKDLMLKVSNAKDQAEKNLPVTLAMLENRIRKAVVSGIESKVAYTFDETYTDTFVVSYLISVLTLSGFSCKLRANQLVIGW